MPSIKVNNPDIPEWAVWEDDKIIDNCFIAITRKIPEEVFCRSAQDIDWSSFKYKDWRDLATAMGKIGLTNQMYNERDFYKNSKFVKEKINEQLPILFQSVWDEMQFVHKKLKPEYWISHPYVSLLDRTHNKGYEQMKVLTSAVVLKHLIDNKTTVDINTVNMISNLLNGYAIFSFYPYQYIPNLFEDKAVFDEANRERKNEIRLQNTFINLICRDNDVEGAYQFLEKHCPKDFESLRC